MRINSRDETLKRNYIQKYQFLIGEYEQVKAKTHPHFRWVKDFYAHHGTCAQNFLKYYARYRASADPQALLPGKRGPKWRTRRPSADIEAAALELRQRGLNRYELHCLLKPTLGAATPSPSALYRLFRRHGVQRIKPPMQELKRRMIQSRAGELAHVDCHHLSRDLIASDPRRRYLVCVVDGYSRLAWAECIDDISSLSVMFATLRAFNHLTSRYQLRFEAVLTDNGPEFGPGTSRSKDQHPFERLLAELGLKHRYTKPYRPQTNGKVERFWRTLNEDLLDGTHFQSHQHLQDELLAYLLYYNQHRPHQGINGLTPQQMILSPNPADPSSN